MSRLYYGLLLVGVLLSFGCASAPKESTLPDSAVAAVAASEEQISVGKIRAEAISRRWSEQEKKKFTRGVSPLIAVRTLGLSPEQITALGPRVPDAGSASCVLLWDAKLGQVVGTELYLVKAPPAKNEPARFGMHVARYVGSL
jgi:hypothetical protein